jgi:hypothetical protein
VARTIHLDDNERAVLEALYAIDPAADSWIAAYATGLDPAAHGADAIASTMQGTMAVLRRLCQRKLVDGEPGERGLHRGYALNAKGLGAIGRG